MAHRESESRTRLRPAQFQILGMLGIDGNPIQQTFHDLVRIHSIGFRLEGADDAVSKRVAEGVDGRARIFAPVE